MDYAVARQIGVSSRTKVSCAVGIDKARRIDKASLLNCFDESVAVLDCEGDEMRKMCSHV